MSVSMYSFSAPVFVRMLGNLLTWLEKAEAHAQARKWDPDLLLTARLAPDMLPFSAQIQIACDAAKFGVARLSGVDAPKFPDDEKTLAELKERVRKTIAYMQSVPAAKLEGTEDKDITVPLRDRSMVFKGEVFLKSFCLPIFLFHVTMTYALLRHNGVELGKMDYLGAPQ